MLEEILLEPTRDVRRRKPVGPSEGTSQLAAGPCDIARGNQRLRVFDHIDQGAQAAVGRVARTGALQATVVDRVGDEVEDRFGLPFRREDRRGIAIGVVGQLV